MKREEYDIPMNAWQKGYMVDAFEEVARIEDGCGYSWHELSVFRNKLNNRLGYVSGSGCSCSSLMEGICYFSDLIPLNKSTMESFVQHVMSEWDSRYATQKIEVISKVMKEVDKYDEN